MRDAEGRPTRLCTVRTEPESAIWLPKPLHWVLLIVLAILVHITVEIVTSKPVSEDVPPPIYLPY